MRNTAQFGAKCLLDILSEFMHNIPVFNHLYWCPMELHTIETKPSEPAEFNDGRADLQAEFERVFAKVLADMSHLSRAEIVEALARETAEWVVRYDEFLGDDQPRTDVLPSLN